MGRILTATTIAIALASSACAQVVPKLSGTSDKELSYSKVGGSFLLATAKFSMGKEATLARPVTAGCRLGHRSQE